MYFYMGILCNYQGYKRCFGIFTLFFYFYFYFLIRKFLAHVQHVLMRRWCPRHMRNACDVTQWPKPAFHCFHRCSTMSFSIWYGTWRLMVVRLSPMVVWCFASFFFLSWPIMYNIILFVSHFFILVFIILISCFILFLFIEIFFFSI